MTNSHLLSQIAQRASALANGFWTGHSPLNPSQPSLQQMFDPNAIKQTAWQAATAGDTNSLVHSTLEGLMMGSPEGAASLINEAPQLVYKDLPAAAATAKQLPRIIANAAHNLAPDLSAEAGFAKIPAKRMKINTNGVNPAVDQQGPLFPPRAQNSVADGSSSLPPISAETNQSTKISRPNALIRAGNAIKSDVGKVQAPDANKSLFGSEHTAQIQDALQRNGVDNYSQLPAAARKLFSSTINPELSTNPKTLPIDTVVNNVVSGMRKLSPGLDVREAKNAAANVINDLYNIARNNAPGSEVVPSTIDTPALFNMKQQLNGTTAVSKYFDGVPLTNLTDLATVAGRNAFSNLIADNHPNIAQATKDYGYLKDAVPSLFKAAQQGRGIGVKLPVGPMGVNLGIPDMIGGPLRDLAGGTLRTAGRVAETPVGKAIGAAGLVAGGTALGMSGLPQIVGSSQVPNKLRNVALDVLGGQPKAANDQSVGNQGQTQTGPGVKGNGGIHDDSLPQNQDLSNYRPSNGDYTLPNVNAQTVVPGYMSTDEYNTQRDQLTKGLYDPASAVIPGRQKAIEQDINNLDTKYATGQANKKAYIDGHQLPAQTVDMLQKAPIANANLKDLYARVQQTPPDISNKVFGNPKAYLSGPYAAMATEMLGLQNYALSVFPNMKPDDVAKLLPTTADSLPQALAKLDYIYSNMAMQVDNYKDVYGLVAQSIPGVAQNNFPGSQPQRNQSLPPVSSSGPASMAPAIPTGKLPPIVQGLQLSPLNQSVPTP